MGFYDKNKSLYLQSEKWKQFRNEKFEEYPTCLICGGKDNLTLHHNTYENFGNEQDDEVEVICNSCHSKVHKSGIKDMRNVLMVNNDFIINHHIESIVENRKELEDMLFEQRIYRKNNFKENFTFLDIKEISKLKSVYSHILYEFASKNKELRYYLMPIDEFKKYFQVPKKYSMSNIDQRILDPIVKEVNEKTRFNIKITKVKKHNIVTHIRFTFLSK